MHDHSDDLPVTDFMKTSLRALRRIRPRVGMSSPLIPASCATLEAEHGAHIVADEATIFRPRLGRSAWLTTILGPHSQSEPRSAIRSIASTAMLALPPSSAKDPNNSRGRRPEPGNHPNHERRDIKRAHFS